MPTFQRARWFEPYMQHKRFKGVKGGRGSGKTSHLAGRFVEIAWRTRVRILCCREIEASMKGSVYESIRKAVIRSNLSHDFNFKLGVIECRRTGSEFLFAGLRTDPDKILSLESISFVWVEQAEKVSEESLKLLTPTIREPYSEIWFSWNPRYPTDAVEVFFDKLKDHALTRHITYKDNPFFPDVLEYERKLCEELMPEGYPHIWLGEYREYGDALTLMPYAKLKQCIQLDKKLKITLTEDQWSYAGLDVADGGKDVPALAIRRGAKVLFARELRTAKNGYEIATQALPEMTSQRIARCYYDATGVGASIKSEFIRAARGNRLSFAPEPFFFGGKVRKKERDFERGVKNGDFFANAAAQGYWNLKLRLERSMRLIDGAKVDLDKCLILPHNTDDKVLQELSQIHYERNTLDKIHIDKKAGKASPNLADAIMMSFVRDIERGLTAYV